METIYKIACPRCKEINQFSNGDETDLTKPYIEAIRCWNCKHEWLLEGAEDWTNLEEANIGYGKKPE